MTSFKFASIAQAFLAAATALCAISFSGVAQATPVVQVYLPDGSYGSDISTESWELTTTDETAEVGVLVKLKDADSKKGTAAQTLDDVRLVIAFDATNDASGITLTDASGNTIVGTLNISGDVPDGLEPAGVYGAGTSYIEFDLGQFTGAAGNEVCNTTDAGEGCVNGEVNTYSLTLTGIAGTVHLDAVGIDEKDKYKSAPNSHDAAISTAGSVPELSAGGFASAAVLLGGATLLTTTRRRRIS